MKLEKILEEDVFKLNESNISDLSQIVKKGQVTWVLGAGVSVPAGLPQWGKLLDKMWARLSEHVINKSDKSSDGEKEDPFTDARSKIMKSISDVKVYRTKINEAMQGEGKSIFQEINLLETAEYIQNYINDRIRERLGMEDRELFFQILRSLVSCSMQPENKGDVLYDQLKGQAVYEIAEILLGKKGVVITYNYDDVLEFCLEKKDKDSVYVLNDISVDKSLKEGKINIYHPHGSLNIVGSETGEDSARIILTETSYYDLEMQVYNWQNSIQARALLDTSCIFTGFSGEDYNFRRIIKNVDHLHENKKFTGNKRQHYILVCIDETVKNLFSDDSSIKRNDYCYERIQLLQKLYAQYRYWKKHGIIPIWTTFEELPAVIRRIGTK